MLFNMLVGAEGEKGQTDMGRGIVTRNGKAEGDEVIPSLGSR